MTICTQNPSELKNVISEYPATKYLFHELHNIHGVVGELGLFLSSLPDLDNYSYLKLSLVKVKEIYYFFSSEQSITN